jgi:CAAX protease family protein
MDNTLLSPETPSGPGDETAALTPGIPARNAAFFGPNGLRAGWRLIIFISLLAASGFGIRFVARAILGPSKNISMGDHPGFMIVIEALSFLLILVPSVAMSLLERRPLRAYGLGVEGAFGKRFWEGALWGFAGLTALLVVMRLSGVFWFGPMNFNLRSTLMFAALWGIGFLLVGFFEEYAFRGYLQYTLTSGLGFWPATVLTSLLFFQAHRGNPGENWAGLVDVFLAGIVFSVMLWRTGNLWFGVGFHLAWDWAQSFFYGVPDSGLITKGHLFEGQSHGPVWLSGGTVGPEGSIFSALIEVVLIGLVLWRFKRPMYPDAQTLPRQAGALI